MSDQPLQPFSPPSDLFAHFGMFISPATAIEWVLYTVFALWALYTIVAIYHWLKYSHASSVAFPAIGIHLFVSFLLMAYALTGTFHLL